MTKSNLIDRRALRDALGLFVTGVVVLVASAPNASSIGMTINSFTSVSLDPPLVLWCLDKRSDRHNAFVSAARCTVNILCADDHHLSTRLASKGEHKLDGVDLDQDPEGAPALRDALASFRCLVTDVQDAGDHTIVIARVERFQRNQLRHPLVFFRGRYGISDL